MNEKKPTKKELAFALFDKGYGPSDPEIWELRLRGSTRYTSHTEWRNTQGAATPSKPKLSPKAGKPASKSRPLPGGESVSSIDETQSAKQPGVKAEKSTVEVAATSVEEESTEEPEDIEEEEEEAEFVRRIRFIPHSYFRVFWIKRLGVLGQCSGLVRQMPCPSSL